MKMSRAAAGAASLGNSCGAIQATSLGSATTRLPMHRTMAIASSLGGCDFVANPTLGWRYANVFWRPEVAADVVSFVSSPANFSGGPTVADLQRFAIVARSAADGLHLLWDDGTQLWVMGDARDGQALAALLPFDETTGRRTIAAAHARNRLAGIRLPLAVNMTRQAVNRFALRLRALDGLLGGSTRRELAIGLFGADRVPGGAAWKTSDLRSLTYRLVDDALALSRGGYLQLLR